MRVVAARGASSCGRISAPEPYFITSWSVLLIFLPAPYVWGCLPTFMCLNNWVHRIEKHPRSLCGGAPLLIKASHLNPPEICLNLCIIFQSPCTSMQGFTTVIKSFARQITSRSFVAEGYSGVFWGVLTTKLHQNSQVFFFTSSINSFCFTTKRASWLCQLIIEFNVHIHPLYQ